jgi:hypothetical protein
LDYSTKLSYLDAALITTGTDALSPSILYNSFMGDIYGSFSVLFMPLVSLFSSSYQDVYGVVLLLSPELILAIGDYFTMYYAPSFLNSQVSACFDSYVTNLNYVFGEGILTFFMFLFFS